MGTLCSATVEAADTASARGALEAAFDAIARLDQVFSSWRDDSETARLNALAAEKPFTCSELMYGALAIAVTLAEETRGAYDPTIEPLMRAWDMRGEGRVPSQREIERARGLVGWKGIVLDQDSLTVRLVKRGMGVEFGAIGKGIALDHATAVLAGDRVPRALINFGGEIAALSDGPPWPVAIADPDDRMAPAVRLTLDTGAVSTSGQSERGVTVGSRRYGHILDPRSGRPLDRAGSVTVIAGSATQADALSTALFVMGRDATDAFARAHPEIGVIWLERLDGRLHCWAWNAHDAVPEAGVAMQWMDQPRESASSPAR